MDPCIPRQRQACCSRDQGAPAHHTRIPSHSSKSVSRYSQDHNKALDHHAGCQALAKRLYVHIHLVPGALGEYVISAWSVSSLGENEQFLLEWQKVRRRHQDSVHVMAILT